MRTVAEILEALEKCETNLRLDEQRHRYQRAELLEELEATSRAVADRTEDGEKRLMRESL